MADRVLKTLNVEVERHSNPEYGTGLDQGVKFKGIEGYWKVSSKSDIYGNAKVAANWPPPLGTVFLAELAVKPAKKPGCYYRDIWDIKTKTGPAESWDWESELTGGSPPETAAPASSEQPWSGGGQPAARATDGKERSIERQVVLKAEAEVLAAALAGGDKLVDLLWHEFRNHCAELWTGWQPVPQEQPAEPATQPQAPDTGELRDEDIPF